MDASKSVLCVLSQSDVSVSQEAIELALVAAAFDAKVSVLFRSAGAAVLAQSVVNDDDSEEHHPVTMLQGFGVDDIFVDEAGGAGQTGLPFDGVEFVGLDTQRWLIASADIVIND